MSIDAVLAAVSAITALLSAVGAWRQVRVRRAEEEVAHRFIREPQPVLTAESDPRSLNEYLFLHAGKLSVREFAGDTEIRNVVGRAVSRIDDLLESPDQGFQEEELRPAGPAHLSAANSAIQRGDTVGALARLRLWVELELQQLAEMAEAPRRQQGGPSRAIRPLARLGLITQAEAKVLSDAVRLANGAVHGEVVTQEEAAEAVRSVGNVMLDIERRLPEWRSTNR